MDSCWRLLVWNISSSSSCPQRVIPGCIKLVRPPSFVWANSRRRQVELSGLWKVTGLRVVWRRFGLVVNARTNNSWRVKVARCWVSVVSCVETTSSSQDNTFLVFRTSYTVSSPMDLFWCLTVLLVLLETCVKLSSLKELLFVIAHSAFYHFEYTRVCAYDALFLFT